MLIHVIIVGYFNRPFVPIDWPSPEMFNKETLNGILGQRDSRDISRQFTHSRRVKNIFLGSLQVSEIHLGNRTRKLI